MPPPALPCISSRDAPLYAERKQTHGKGRSHLRLASAAENLQSCPLQLRRQIFKPVLSLGENIEGDSFLEFIELLALLDDFPTTWSPQLEFKSPEET